MKMRILGLCLLTLVPIARARAGNETGNAKSIMSFLTFSRDRTKILFSDVLFDKKTGEPLARPMDDIGLGGSGLSPDARRAVGFSSYDDQVAKVWDVRSGEKLFELKHGAELAYAKFTPDGEKIVTASKAGLVRVWAAENGSPLGEVRTNFRGWGEIEFSADSKQAWVTSWISGTYNSHDFEILDLDRYQLEPSLRAEDFYADRLDGNPVLFDRGISEKGLAARQCHSYPLRCFIYFFDLDHQKFVRKIESMDDHFSVTPDGKTLATFDGEVLVLWDISTGKQVRSLKTEKIEKVWPFMISRDGNRLLMGDEGRLLLWDLESGQITQTGINANGSGLTRFGLADEFAVQDTHWGARSLRVFRFSDGAFVRAYNVISTGMPFASNDGSTLVIRGGSHVNSVRVFDGRSGAFVRALRGPDQSALFPISLSSGGRYLLTSSKSEMDTINQLDSDYVLSLWSLASGKRVTDLKGHRAFHGYFHYFSDDESLGVTLSRDGKVLFVWKTSDGEVQSTIPLEKEVELFDIQFRPSSHQLAIKVREWPGGNEVLRSFDADTGALLWSREEENLDPIQFSADGSRGLSKVRRGGGSGVSFFWSADSGKTLGSIGYYGDACRLSPSGDEIYSLAAWELKAWDASTLKEIGKLAFDRYAILDDSLAVSPEGRYLKVSPNRPQELPGFWIIDSSTLKILWSGNIWSSSRFLTGGLLLEKLNRSELLIRKQDSGEVVKKIRLY
jgi:WD40 repeat protein